ncbi:hypothetical protein ACIBK9_40885 [Nonomuraea sp. NPDC050227]|uniref:hypothetical protein n=1 Tax=Nonomuraea sp. NPDC050227 TaxID=3364360 RepID=UPI00378E03EB
MIAASRARIRRGRGKTIGAAAVTEKAVLSVAPQLRDIAHGSCLPGRRRTAVRPSP